MGIYGPRTIFCIAVTGCPGTHEFLLQDDGKWLHVKETLEIGEAPLLTLPFCQLSPKLRSTLCLPPFSESLRTLVTSRDAASAPENARLFQKMNHFLTSAWLAMLQARARCSVLAI